MRFRMVMTVSPGLKLLMSSSSAGASSSSCRSCRCLEGLVLFPVKMAAIRRFKPLFDRILVEKFLPEVKTKGGVLLPEKGVGSVLEGTVVAVGPGARDKSGNVVPVSVKVGDKVLLPEYGGTKVTMEEKEYHIFRDSDILGTFE